MSCSHHQELLIRDLGILLLVVVILFLGRELLCWFFKNNTMITRLDAIYTDVRELKAELTKILR